MRSYKNTNNGRWCLSEGIYVELTMGQASWSVTVNHLKASWSLTVNYGEVPQVWNTTIYLQSVGA